AGRHQHHIEQRHLRESHTVLTADGLRFSHRLFVVLALDAIFAPTRSALAQTTAQIPLQFDFLNPGARSLGMGSAFIGAADDATAAFANPAGLASLSTREILGELRLRRVEQRFLQGGRVSGTPTGIGLDTIAGPLYGTDVDRHLSPAFISVVLPLLRV